MAPPVNLLQAETAADGLAKQIETINVSGLHRLRVALHPSTLGELELTIQRSLEGDVSVQITAQQQTAREVLELHLPKIRTLLEEQQGRFVDVSVSQDNGGTQSQSQGRDQAPTDAPDHALNKRSPDLDGQGSGIFRQPSDSRHDGLVEAYV
ncbi:MAG: flagellar hook-length control protein FliK [Pseudomonadota bacterium]